MQIPRVNRDVTITYVHDMIRWRLSVYFVENEYPTYLLTFSITLLYIPYDR